VVTAATTAEWICTQCGTTNRKLVPSRMSQTEDRCVTCGAEHVVELDSRPVRWRARAKE
jgi:DNA-directed RNA polymerase subunit RPC12/RpoP